MKTAPAERRPTGMATVEGPLVYEVGSYGGGEVLVSFAEGEGS